MKFEKGCEILWQDKKRYFGLPISFTRYYLVRKPGEWLKFFSHEGVFSALIDEVNIYRCFDVQMTMTLSDKIFKTGTITMKANDDSNPVITIKSVKEPYKFRSLLSSLIEQERKARGIGVTEFQKPNIK